MTEHTPGPWEAIREYANRWRIERKRDGFVPLSLGIVTTTVCEVGGSDPSVAEANAQLMARAPDLLADNARLRAALQNLSDDVRDYGTGKLRVRDSCWQARAALNPTEDGE